MLHMKSLLFIENPEITEKFVSRILRLAARLRASHIYSKEEENSNHAADHGLKITGKKIFRKLRFAARLRVL